MGRRQQPERGALLLGTTERLRQTLENPHAPKDRAFYNQILTSRQTQLSADGFRAAWECGCQLTATQAIAEAKLAIHGHGESTT